MNVALWIGQGVLAALFAVSGALKSAQSKERMLATGQTGVRDVPLPAIRLVAACELLAVIGLLVPQATGIVPVLTPLAALGLAVVMVGAAAAHARLREPRTVAVNAVILLVCLAVAVGRFAGA
ncbi:MAG: DoxX family protein [Pseudonocardiaceae bacterium]